MAFRVGFRIDRVQHVVVVDEEPADAAELVEGVEEVAFLVEDLDAVVAAVGHEQAPLRVEFEGVRRPELPGSRPDLAPLHHVLALGAEFHDASRGARRRILVLPAVSVGDEDVAFRRGDDVAGLVEVIRPAPRDPGGSERHQDLPFRAELEDLVALALLLVARRVGDPDVPVLIHMEPVREDEQPCPEARENFAGVAVELENGIHVGTAAAVREGVAAATVVGPQLPVRADVHPCGGAPLPAVRQRTEARDHFGGWIWEIAGHGGIGHLGAVGHFGRRRFIPAAVSWSTRPRSNGENHDE